MTFQLIFNIVIVLSILFIIYFIKKTKKAMTTDLALEIQTLKSDVTTLLQAVQGALSNIATAPTTDPTAVEALQAIDKQITDFTASLTPATTTTTTVAETTTTTTAVVTETTTTSPVSDTTTVDPNATTETTTVGA